jgi:hypothetical protein
MMCEKSGKKAVSVGAGPVRIGRQEKKRKLNAAFSAGTLEQLIG